MEQINKNLFNNTKLAYITNSNKDLVKSFFIFWTLNNQFFVKTGTILLKLFLKIKLPIKNMLQKTIFSQFCGGETLRECNKIISSLAKYKIYAMPEYSVEAESSYKGFENYKNDSIDLINFLGNQKLPFIAIKCTGLMDIESLEKISSNNLSFDSLECKQFEERINELCLAASKNNVKILIDAEESWIQNAIDSVATKLMKIYNKKSPMLFLTHQCYRKGTLSKIKSNLHKAKHESYYLGVKLVRGAYMEKERHRALKNGYDSPIQDTKPNTDKEFDDSVKFCIENLKNLSLWIGSHNEDSFYRIMCLMNKKNIVKGDKRIWFSQLYGMSDNISFSLANLGYNVVKLIPYGPIEKTIPYLLRRAKENSSVRGQSSRQFTLVKNEMKRRKILSLL